MPPYESSIPRRCRNDAALLIQKRAHASAGAYDGFSPLRSGEGDGGHLAAATLPLEKGADVPTQGQRAGRTATSTTR